MQDESQFCQFCQASLRIHHLKYDGRVDFSIPTTPVAGSRGIDEARLLRELDAITSEGRNREMKDGPLAFGIHLSYAST